MSTIEQYLNLITSEHNKQPNFMSVVTTLVQPQADLQDLVFSMLSKFDLDKAIGEQLDIIGLWIGRSRFLSIPITGIYFSFDTEGVGFDEGTWWSPFDPETELVALPDDSYRTLLRARIANNQWDGTIPSAYEFMAQVFPDHTFFIQDNQDMSMYVGVLGAEPLDAVTLALFTGGYLNVKPAGVRIAGYITGDAPLFGFDVENETISGFDTGSWAQIS